MKKNYFRLFIVILPLIFLGLSCDSKGTDGGMFKSEDITETWQQKVFAGAQGKKVSTISNVDVELIKFDPSDSAIIYITTFNDGIYKTDDGGNRWRKLNAPPERIRDIDIDPVYTNNVYAVRGLNVIKSTDFGETWQTVYTDPQGATMTQVKVDWFNQQHIIATNSNGSILISEDEGRNWRALHEIDLVIKKVIMSPSDSRTMYLMALDGPIFKTTDGGIVWKNLFDAEYINKFPDYVVSRSLIMDPNDSRTLYISTPVGILVTRDSGETWDYFETLIEKRAVQNNEIKNITVIPGDPNTVVFSIGKLIHKTENSGKTWRTIETFPTSRLITAIVADPENVGVLYAGVLYVEPPKKAFFAR